jgi:hypothetical protein
MRVVATYTVADQSVTCVTLFIGTPWALQQEECGNQPDNDAQNIQKDI